MYVRIRFRAPRVALVDPRVELWLGDQRVFEGPFMGGVDVTISLGPGEHVLEARLVGPHGQTKRQRVGLAVPPTHYREDARMETWLVYSQISANFEPRARVRVG